MKVAVIDLGTNTFHLLIIKKDDQGLLDEICRRRIYVFLGEQGLHHISKSAYQRGIEAIRSFIHLIQKHQVGRIKAVGTSALRNADNGQQFIKEIKAMFDLEIDVISGSQEAVYIHKGVSQLIKDKNHYDLIMDIGGGSVEFIHTHRGQILWAQSFKMGITVLYKCLTQELYAEGQAQRLYQYIDDGFEGSQLINPIRVDRLIGASGTFDVLANMTSAPNKKFTKVDIRAFTAFYQVCYNLSLKERKTHPKIPKERAKYLPAALFLVDYVIKKLSIQELYVSHYAMKEGIAVDI